MPARIDYFKVMYELSQTFGSAHNRKELLALIFKSAMDILEGKAAALYLESGKEELTPVAQKGLSARYFRSRKSRLARQIVSRVLDEGFLYIREAAAEPSLEYPDAKQAEGIASILAVPVMVKGKAIGVFCLFTARPRDFAPEARQFLSFLAQQAGGVVEHAHLIDQLRQETKLFFDLAVKLSGSLEVKEILHALTVNLAAALGVKGASIRLLDESKQTLELVASHGLSAKYLRKGPVSAKKNLARIVQGKETILTQDVEADKRVQYRKMKQEEGIATILSVPVKTKEGAIGVLRLYSAVERKFTRDEIMLVTTLAYLGGLAIQNACLYLTCQTDMKDLKEELWSHRSWF